MLRPFCEAFPQMPDDKRKTAQDRKLVAATQPYEVRYFAKKHGITVGQARMIINQYGPSRRKCDAAARGLLASIGDGHEAL